MSVLINCCSRIYRALLYTYPREFRLEYGGEMERMFRDGCRDAARANDPMKIAHFVVASGADWLATSVRERIDSVRSIVSTARTAAPRGFANEWALTILMYLFASTTLVQAYVIPTDEERVIAQETIALLADRP